MVAQRREKEAGDELAFAAALLKRTQASAEAVAAYERAASAASNVDAELMAHVAEAFRQIEAQRTKLTALAATANEKLAALPHEVRAAIEPPALVWLLAEGESVIDHVARRPLLRAVVALDQSPHFAAVRAGA